MPTHIKIYTKEKILWTVFALNIVAIIWTLVDTGFAVKLSTNTLLLSFTLLASGALLILHAAWTLTPLRALFFILTTAFLGLLAEYDGLTHGTLFGGRYDYTISGPTLFHVPLLIVAYWAIFIYTGYAVTNSFVYWLKKQKPTSSNHQLLLLIFLIFIDASLVTLLDLFMDPLAVKAGMWTWLDGGFYFGVPVGNFIGWFLVTALATGIFRVFEYVHPQTASALPQRIYVTSVAGYTALALAFTFASLHNCQKALAAFAGSLILVVVMTNLALFIRSGAYKSGGIR